MRTVAAATKETVLVGPSTTIQQASATMLDRHVEAVIVVDGKKVRGLISADDVTRALAEGRDATSTPVQAITQPDPVLVDIDAPLAEVHQRMRAAQRPLVVVVGHDGQAMGVLIDHEAAP
jgi:CBS domain-containing protein